MQATLRCWSYGLHAIWKSTPFLGISHEEITEAYQDVSHCRRWREPERGRILGNCLRCGAQFRKFLNKGGQRLRTLSALLDDSDLVEHHLEGEYSVWMQRVWRGTDVNLISSDRFTALKASRVERLASQ